jgi:hypothetical protein
MYLNKVFFKFKFYKTVKIMMTLKVQVDKIQSVHALETPKKGELE